MMKTDLTAQELFVLLEREFRRRKPSSCPTCGASLPFLVEHHDAHAPNWQVIPAGECPENCVDVLEEVVAEYQRLYRLKGARPD